jgi:ankyrin repeat protein
MKNLFSKRVNSELCAAIRDDDLFSVIYHLKNKDYLEKPIDSNGNTPLLVAVMNKSARTVRFLLSIGARITAINDKKLNAFDLASLNEDRYLSRLLFISIQLDKLLADYITKCPVIYSVEIKLKPSQKLIQIIAQEAKPLIEYSRATGVYQKFDLLRTLRSLSMIAATSQNEIQFREKLQNFFGRREQWTQNTEMDYCFSPHSVVNKICFEAAKLLIPESKQVESQDEEQKRPYDYLLQKRLTEERSEDWRQWQNNLECTGLLPLNIAEVFCWRDAESKFTYGELHYVPEMLKIAIDNIKKGEISYERIWFKQDPKVRKSLKDKTPPLSRSVLYIMRQWGECWQELIDYSLNMDKIRKDPQSIMGRLNELCEGLYRGSKNGTGTEDKADVTARDAVGVFSEWFHSLEESDQKEIKNWRAPDLTRNIGQIMQSLQGSNSLDEIIDPEFCVDILGNAIRQIIQVNDENIANLQQKLNEKQEIREKTLLQKYKTTHLKSAKKFDELHQKALKEIQSAKRPGILIDNTASGFGQVFENSISIAINKSEEPLFHELSLDSDGLSRSMVRNIDLIDTDCLDMTFLCAAQQNECLELFRSEIKKIFSREIIEGSGLIISEILNYYPDLLNEPIFSEDALSYTTPLILAVTQKDKWTVKLFLEKGANILAMDSNNRHALNVALIVHDFEILNILNENAQLLLRKVLVENDPAIAKKIVAINPDLVNKPFQDESLLTWVLKDPHTHILSIFLEIYHQHLPGLFLEMSSDKNLLEMGKKYNRLSELRDLAHKQFLDALKQGASTLVKAILDYYPEFINEPCIENSHSVTPLMLAVYYDHESMFQSLVISSEHCDEKVVRLVNNELRKNRRVIHTLQVAALSSILINQNDFILGKILDKNPDFINSICLSGETSFTFLLNMAAKAKITPSISTVDILLKKGASILKKNEYGQHPLKIVFKHQWLPFLPGFESRIRSDFYQAVKAGLLDQVKEILQYFPDYANRQLELIDGGFTTPLIVAVSEDEFDVGKFLLESGADIFGVNNEGYNAIQTALGEDFVKLLFKHSLKLLEQALRSSDFDTVKKIFELDVDFNLSRIAMGETLLTFALKTPDNNREIVQYLLEEKMDIFTINSLGESPLKIASEKGRLDELRINTNQKFSEVIRQGDIRKVEIILFYYPGFLNKPLAGETYESTPLMTAASKKQEEIVSFFLQDSKLLVDESFILRREITQQLTQDGTQKSQEIHSLLQAAAFEKVLKNKGPEAVYDIVLSTFPELLNKSLTFLDFETPVTHAIKSKSARVLNLVGHRQTNVFITNSQGQSPFDLVRAQHIQFLKKKIFKNIKILEEELGRDMKDEVSNLLRIKLSKTVSLTPVKAQEIENSLKSFRSNSGFFSSSKIIQESIKHLEYSILEIRGGSRIMDLT